MVLSIQSHRFNSFARFRLSSLLPSLYQNGRNATTFTGRNDHSLSSVVSDFEPDELHDDGEAKQKDNALRLALTQLAGEFGRESMLSLQRFFNSRRAPVISTGSLKLDLALGIGGLPKRIIAEIKHFSHQHNLILIDEFNNDPKCDGCMLPIFTPFYSCTECNFSLDKACIGLPRKKYWQYDRHPLILILNTWEEDPFQCAICEQYCYGFSYNCDRCHRFLDVRCFKLTKDSIEHGGHEHPLYLAVESENRHCSGCSVSGESQTFRCVVCDFNLDFKCATLPDKARHRYDEHPLFLTYIDPNDYQYVCQICEKERDPKLWFYRCEECDFDAHRECVLGKNPFIKLGGSYTYDIHPHPLALVEKTDDYPACHACGEPCDDLALECTDYQCNFIIHKRGMGAMH